MIQINKTCQVPGTKRVTWCPGVLCHVCVRGDEQPASLSIAVEFHTGMPFAPGAEYTLAGSRKRPLGAADKMFVCVNPSNLLGVL